MRNVNPVLAELLEGVDWDLVPPRINVAPGTDVLTVDQSEGGRRLVARRWGLVPRWSRAERERDRRGTLLINARSETIHEKPSFRASFRDRRCVLPADAYFEWKEVGSVKQPYLVEVQGDTGLRLAGLWERHETDEGVTETCAIATTSPAPALRNLHDRMPVLLTPDAAELWLDPETPPDVLRGLLIPWPGEGLRYYAVDRRMGNSKHQDPGLLDPVPDPFADAVPQSTLDFGDERAHADDQRGTR